MLNGWHSIFHQSFKKIFQANLFNDVKFCYFNFVFSSKNHMKFQWNVKLCLASCFEIAIFGLLRLMCSSANEPWTLNSQISIGLWWHGTVALCRSYTPKSKKQQSVNKLKRLRFWTQLTCSFFQELSRKTFSFEFWFSML